MEPVNESTPLNDLGIQSVQHDLDSHNVAATSGGWNEHTLRTLSSLNSNPYNQDNEEMEMRGFIGFPSAGAVIDYLLAREFQHIDCVCVVDVHDLKNLAPVNAGLPEANLVIPTLTRGYIMAALTENSPHAEHVAEYIGKPPEPAGDADEFDMPMGFAEWWLSVGGRFWVRGLDKDGNPPACPDMPVDLNVQMEDDVNMDTPLDLDVEVPQNSAQVDVQAAHQQNAAPYSSRTAASAKHLRSISGRYGLYMHHTFSTGSLRMWSEMGIELPATVAQQHISYHPIFSFAPVYNVDLRLLGDIPVTDVELLTFFPDHLVFWPDMIYRLCSAGWQTAGMLRVMYAARGVNTYSAEDKGVMARDNSRVGHSRRILGVKVEEEPRLEPYTDLAMANWREPRKGDVMKYTCLRKLTDYYVSDLADGVLPYMFPDGENGGPLTGAIRITRTHPDDAEVKALKLSGVSAFLKKHSLYPAAVSAGPQNPPTPVQKQT
ncbi:hypothetical protein P171DRAFT_480041 [Karstenula rhodostoma CBS 690.94]|uniref:Uncharacterized protein n=1 Tax=Karstenula rhodostoma CBS 690.94 TaxID=1392251 RepID=A0A9P4PXE5_9PLEO|nr:hypothetical protein P171DRAFT_480041 [Karstenula rhodostoma CBS 690.94]